MRIHSMALAIGMTVMLAACGTQDGSSRSTPPASGAPAAAPGQPAAAPPRADQPAHPSTPPPVAPPAAGAATAAQPAPAIPAPAPAPAPSPAPGTTPSPPPAAAPGTPASPAAAPSAAEAAAERDLAISREVRAGLTHDTHLARDAKDVQVSTRAGVVTLTGTVSSDADRRAIRSQAERVSGVVRVEDQLVVR